MLGVTDKNAPGTGIFAARWLAWLTAALGGLTSAIGLLSAGGTGRTTVTSIHGEHVELYGRGVYRHDTVFIAASSRGTDLVTLVIGVPLLAFLLSRQRRGRPRWTILLVGTLGYFVYVYASRALGNAYNSLFLAYIATFSAALFATFLAVTDVLDGRVAVPSGRLAWLLSRFLFICAAVTAAVWLLPLADVAISGGTPKYLDTYTTTITDVLDLGVLVPTLVLAGVLTDRRIPLGTVLASMLLVLLLFVAGTIITGTIFQVIADVSYTPGEVIGPIAGFLFLAGVAAWLLAATLRETDT